MTDDTQHRINLLAGPALRASACKNLVSTLKISLIHPRNFFETPLEALWNTHLPAVINVIHAYWMVVIVQSFCSHNMWTPHKMYADPLFIEKPFQPSASSDSNNWKSHNHYIDVAKLSSSSVAVQTNLNWDLALHLVITTPPPPGKVEIQPLLDYLGLWNLVWKL